MSKLPPRNSPVNNPRSTKNRHASSPGSGGSGIPDIRPRRPQKGDLPGCVHTRPLVDLGVTWDDFAEHVRDQARSSNPEAIGQQIALMIIEGLGPVHLRAELDNLNVAYIGSDVSSASAKPWIIIPVQGEQGLLRMSEEVEQALKDVLALIAERSNLWGLGSIRTSLKPRFDPDGVSDPDDPQYLTPEQEIYHRDGEAIDLYRTARTITTTFVRQAKTLKNHVSNVVAVFDCDPVFENVLRYDDLDNKIWARKPLPWSLPDEHFPREWGKTDSGEAAVWFANSQWELAVPTPMVKEAVDIVAQRCTVQKVRNRLKVLKWDGVPRVGSHDSPAPGWLATYFGASNEGNLGTYVRLVGRYWLMSAVARAFDPGCKVDTMLILEGGGGIHKSSGMALLGNIVPKVVKDTPLDLRSKDRFQQLDGAWLYEIAELPGVTNKQSSDELKAFISSPSDNYRRSHRPDVADTPRQSVFFATANPSDDAGYLNDRSGNERRQWPVLVKSADMIGLDRDRDQIWAEAVHLYREGAYLRKLAGRGTAGIVPMHARYWTDKDDLHLWEQEGRKRAHSGDAIVDLLRASLFGPDGYFMTDVKAQLSDLAKRMPQCNNTHRSFHFERPWRCLSQDFILRQLLADEATTRDGKRIASALRELGLTTDPNKRVRQGIDMQPKRHAVMVSAESDARRRLLLASLISYKGELDEALAAAKAPDDVMVEIRDACFEINAGARSEAELAPGLTLAIGGLRMLFGGPSEGVAKEVLSMLGDVVGLDLTEGHSIQVGTDPTDCDPED